MLNIGEALKQLREEKESWEIYDDEVFFPALEEASKKLGFELEGEANGEFAEITTIFDVDGNFETLDIEDCEEKYKTKEELVKAILSHFEPKDKYYVVAWDEQSEEDEDLGEYNTLKEAEQAAKDVVELDGYASAEVHYKGELMRHFGLEESLKESWKEEKDADRAKFLNELSEKGPITFVKLGSMSFAPYFTSGWDRYKRGRYQHTDLHNGWARQKLNYPNFYILLKNNNTGSGDFFAIKISPKCFNDLKKKEKDIEGKTYDNWEALNDDLNLEIWDYTLSPERIAWDDRKYEAGRGFTRIVDVGARNESLKESLKGFNYKGLHIVYESPDDEKAIKEWIDDMLEEYSEWFKSNKVKEIKVIEGGFLIDGKPAEYVLGTLYVQGKEVLREDWSDETDDEDDANREERTETIDIYYNPEHKVFLVGDPLDILNEFDDLEFKKYEDIEFKLQNELPALVSYDFNTWDVEVGPLDKETLNELIKAYEQGDNVDYDDDESHYDADDYLTEPVGQVVITYYDIKVIRESKERRCIKEHADLDKVFAVIECNWNRVQDLSDKEKLEIMGYDSLEEFIEDDFEEDEIEDRFNWYIQDYDTKDSLEQFGCEILGSFDDEGVLTQYFKVKLNKSDTNSIRDLWFVTDLIEVNLEELFKNTYIDELLHLFN